MVAERAARILSKMLEVCRHSVNRPFVRPHGLAAFDAALVPRPQGYSLVNRNLLPPAWAPHFAYSTHGHLKIISPSRKNVNSRLAAARAQGPDPFPSFARPRYPTSPGNTRAKILSTLRNWRSREKDSAIWSEVRTARISGSDSIAARKSDSSSQARMA